MTALRKTRINWTDTEYALIADRFFAFKRAGLSNPQAFKRAQYAVDESRQRDINGVAMSMPVLVKMVNPDPVAQAELDLAILPELTGRPAPAKPVKVNVELPDTVPPPAAPTPPPQTHPFDDMIQQAVDKAVATVVNTAIEQQHSLLRDMMQSLLAQQFDAIMCYWDPAYKARVELTPEYVGTQALPALLSEVRVRQRRVLIVAGNRVDDLYPVKLNFKNVEFEFVESDKSKSLGRGGFYDVVIATRHVSHASMGVLNDLHGNRVIRADGLNNVIATIKKGLDL